MKYQKEVIKNGKQDGTLLYGNYVDENELISFKLGVFYKESEMWQLLIIYSPNVNEQIEIAERVFESII